MKAKYKLWVTPAEHDAIARILATCNLPSATAPGTPVSSLQASPATDMV